jgi:hypothetical protein
VGFGPQVVDLDGDGRRDVLTGSWPGEIYLFRGKAEGGYAAHTKLGDATGKDLHCGNASVVFAVDWDRDGDQDLVVGCIDGQVWWIPNESGTKELRFGAARALEAGGEPIESHHSAPVVADWDGNGTLDLVVGQGDGAVAFYANASRAGEPRLEAGRTLVEPAPLSTDGSRPGQRVKPHVADWNGDGRPDLLLGDFSMGTPKAKDLTAEEKTRLAELELAEGALQTELDGLQSRLLDRALRSIGVEVKDADELPDVLSKLTPAQHEELGPAFQKAMEGDPAMTEWMTRMGEIESAREALQGGPVIQGNVWVFLRTAPAAPASGTGGG